MVKEFLDSMTQHIRIDEDCYGNVLIVLTEAVNNAIVHGNKSDESKTVHLECVLHDDRFEFTVHDQGQGFDPSTLPNPLAEENLLKEGGRGIYLMRTFARDIIFTQHADGLGIHFTMDIPASE